MLLILKEKKIGKNMSNSAKKPKRGRPPKHGGYSLIQRDAMLKDHPHIRRYLQECRDGLVQDVAGSEEALTEQQRIMIDRIVSRLSICRLIECYIEKCGPAGAGCCRKMGPGEGRAAFGL
jgi:hypothetical protein